MEPVESGSLRPDSGAGLLPLLLSMMVWSGWFLWRTSLMATGGRVFCLFEDAMVSMTYAKNLVSGHGLNWARMGRPVEGFTHPLWTALLVPVNALPLAPIHRGLVVSLFSLACLLANVLVVRRLTLRFFATTRARHWMPAALLTSFYYPLNYWALRGMESGLQALLTTASVLLALDIVNRDADRHRALLLLGALSCLLRSDMFLIVAALQVYVVANGGVADRKRRTSWLLGLAGLVLAVAGYGLFRWLYFREIFSNGYYVAIDRIPLAIRLMRGSFLLGASLSGHLALLASIGIGLVLVARRDPGASGLARRMALPAGLFLVGCAYSVYVGGDARSVDPELRANRFIVYLMPLVFVLFNALVNQVADWLALRRPDDELARRFLVTVATVLALAVAEGLWLVPDPGGNWMALLVALPPAEAKGQAELYRRVRQLQAVLGPAGTLATSSAGLPAYFTEYAMVDLAGGNERHIARLAPAAALLPEDFMDYAPGRAKADDPYVLGHYHPDAFLADGSEARSRLLRAAGYRYLSTGDLWLRAPGNGP